MTSVKSFGWASSSWFWGSGCPAFPCGSFQHTQFLMERRAGLLCDFVFNPVPDGHLQPLHRKHQWNHYYLTQTGFKWGLSQVFTFFSLCCWTTCAFLGAMILPETKSIEHTHGDLTPKNNCACATVHKQMRSLSMLLTRSLVLALLRSEGHGLLKNTIFLPPFLSPFGFCCCFLAPPGRCALNFCLPWAIFTARSKPETERRKTRNRIKVFKNL